MLTKGFVKNAATTARDTRLMDAAKIVSNRDGSARAGVLTAYGTNSNVVGTTTSMSVVVDRADFVTTRSASDGVVIFTNDGTVQVAIEAAPAANSRIDVVWVKHNDNAEGNGDATAVPELGVAKGNAAAAPTKPTIPTGALELATLTIPAGATSTRSSGVVLTNSFSFTALQGTPVPFRSLAEMRAWSAAVGSQARLLNGTGVIYRYTGTAWVPLGAVPFATRQGSTTLASGSSPANLNLGDSAFTLDDQLFTTPSSAIIVQTTAYYRMSGQINWQTNGTGQRHVEATVNGSAPSYRMGDSRTVPPAGDGVQSFSVVRPLSAGDIIRLTAFQSSGGALAYAATLTVELVAIV